MTQGRAVTENQKEWKEIQMTTSDILKKIAAAALLLGGLAATGPELSIATARADDTFAPHHWCPGQRHDPPTGPGDVVWDWNVCHTFYFTNYGMGNLVTSYSGENAPVWDGDNPPPPRR